MISSRERYVELELTHGTKVRLIRTRTGVWKGWLAVRWHHIFITLEIAKKSYRLQGLYYHMLDHKQSTVVVWNKNLGQAVASLRRRMLIIDYTPYVHATFEE